MDMRVGVRDPLQTDVPFGCQCPVVAHPFVQVGRHRIRRGQNVRARLALGVVVFFLPSP